MEIRFRATGAVMFESELRAHLLANGGPSYDVLTPEVMEAIGVDPVLEGPQATGGDRYQYSQRAGVEQINGQWYTKYILGPVFDDYTKEDGTVITAAEAEAAYKANKDAEQAKAVRAERDRRLAALDWTQGKDIPDSISAPAAVTRQSLRDVPAQPGFPWEINWPNEAQQ